MNPWGWFDGGVEKKQQGTSLYIITEMDQLDTDRWLSCLTEEKSRPVIGKFSQGWRLKKSTHSWNMFTGLIHTRCHCRFDNSHT